MQALAKLDELYPQNSGYSITQQLAMQLAEPKPWDLAETPISHYKSLKAPYNDWKEVRRRAVLAGQKIMMAKLGKDFF